MCVPVVFFLSTVVLHSVSAGGVYCAKSARARAAALGLEYPGVNGAPDLYRPAHYGMHPGSMPFRHHPYNSNDRELAETGPNMASYRQSQPGVSSLGDGMYNQARHRSPESAFLLSYGTYNPFQSDYTTNQALGFPSRQSVINHRSHFEEVEHVGPPTLSEAPGQPDLASWNPQGRNKPHSFIHNEHGLVVDESVPNRRGMYLHGLPRPRSWSHGPYQRGLTGYGLGRVPVLGSPYFIHRDHVRAMTGQGPAVGRLERTRFPDHLVQPQHRSHDVRQFVHGNPVFRHLTQPKSDPGRISW